MALSFSFTKLRVAWPPGVVHTSDKSKICYWPHFGIWRNLPRQGGMKVQPFTIRVQDRWILMFSGVLRQVVGLVFSHFFTLLSRTSLIPSIKAPFGVKVSLCSTWVSRKLTLKKLATYSDCFNIVWKPWATLVSVSLSFFDRNRCDWPLGFVTFQLLLFLHVCLLFRCVFFRAD